MNDYQSIDLKEVIKKRGQKSYGFLKVAQKADCSWVTIPVFVVCGQQPGPTLLVDACTHGDEYEGSEAIGRFAQQLDTKGLKGTFIGVPALNLEAFSYGKRENHMDYSYTNMNRVFPGNENSYITHKVARFYFDHVVPHADYMINFHGGGNVLYVTPQVGYCDITHEAGQVSHQMAKAFGFECLYGGANPAFTGTMRLASLEAGVPSITVEIGSQSCRHHERFDNIQKCFQGMKNVMKLAGMLEGEVEYLDEYIDSNESLTYIYAKHGGFHIPIRKEKERVRKGEQLAKILDMFGNEIAQVTAPFDGVVYGYCDYPIVQPGNWSYLFAKYEF